MCSCQKGRRWAQKEVFQVLLKIDTQNFFYFLHKVTVACKLKTVLNDCLWKNLVFRSLGQKGLETAKNEVFQVLSKASLAIFCFYARSFSSIKT